MELDKPFKEEVLESNLNNYDDNEEETTDDSDDSLDENEMKNNKNLFMSTMIEALGLRKNIKIIIETFHSSSDINFNYLCEPFRIVFNAYVDAGLLKLKNQPKPVQIIISAIETSGNYINYVLSTWKNPSNHYSEKKAIQRIQKENGESIVKILHLIEMRFSESMLTQEILDIPKQLIFAALFFKYCTEELKYEEIIHLLNEGQSTNISDVIKEFKSRRNEISVFKSVKEAANVLAFKILNEETSLPEEFAKINATRRIQEYLKSSLNLFIYCSTFGLVFSVSNPLGRNKKWKSLNEDNFEKTVKILNENEALKLALEETNQIYGPKIMSSLIEYANKLKLEIDDLSYLLKICVNLDEDFEIVEPKNTPTHFSFYDRFKQLSLYDLDKNESSYDPFKGGRNYDDTYDYLKANNSNFLAKDVIDKNMTGIKNEPDIDEIINYDYLKANNSNFSAKDVTSYDLNKNKENYIIDKNMTGIKNEPDIDEIMSVIDEVTSYKLDNDEIMLENENENKSSFDNDMSVVESSSSNLTPYEAFQNRKIKLDKLRQKNLTETKNLTKYSQWLNDLKNDLKDGQFNIFHPQIEKLLLSIRSVKGNNNNALKALDKQILEISGKLLIQFREVWYKNINNGLFKNTIQFFDKNPEINIEWYYEFRKIIVNDITTSYNYLHGLKLRSISDYNKNQYETISKMIDEFESEFNESDQLSKAVIITKHTIEINKTAYEFLGEHSNYFMTYVQNLPESYKGEKEEILRFVQNYFSTNDKLSLFVNMPDNSPHYEKLVQNKIDKINREFTDRWNEFLQKQGNNISMEATNFTQKYDAFVRSLENFEIKVPYYEIAKELDDLIKEGENLLPEEEDEESEL
ncbi:45532_t:CDS:2 [Gigaspora margarita]|uniref:45532_t:CDS:1 n=1 Tax=Gigaspora margarita TaxID=4874 RepID=A0ABN7UJ94_GIGMA|nr:45532_t:CDS:2 [Gigaspora margarita]